MADIISWKWEFGDGSTSVEQNPEHVYEMPGEYIVSLTVTDLDGNISTTIDTIYVYDFDYSGAVPNASLSDRCYRTPARAGEGYGVSEYRDSFTPGRNWLWPPADIQIGNGYDLQKREIALVLDAKTQREYQINDFDVWRDREGTYDPTAIVSNIHQKAHFSDEGEHVPIRHVEHHLSIKSFDRQAFQGAAGYDSEGLPSGLRIDNQLMKNEETTTPIVSTREIPRDGDIVFQEQVEARNLQLRTTIYGAPYWLANIIPYYETVDKASSPQLRIMSEDGYQSRLAGLPHFHVTRNFYPLLNLATGLDANGGYAALITGPDGRELSAMTVAALGPGPYYPTFDFANVTGNFSMYMWVNNIPLAGLPVQVFAMQNLSVEIHDIAGVYQLMVNHNGTLSPMYPMAFTGTQWTLIVMVRDGLNIRLYENTNLLGTFAIPLAIQQGNTMYFAPAGGMSVFDMCVVPVALNQAEIEYYHGNIIRGGDEVLPPF